MPYTDGVALAKTLVATKPNDIHCYSEDTEILTESGWKTFGALDKNDLVAQWSENEVIKFVKPQEIIWQKYSGDMIKFKHMLLTPNHRMVTVDNQTGAVKVKTALECSKLTSQINYPVKGIIDGTDKYSYEFYELLIAVQADAHLNLDCNAITFSFVKERKVNRLLGLLESLNVKHSIGKFERKGRVETTIRLLSKDPTTLLLRSFFDENKRLSLNLINLSLETKTKLLKSIGHWDGTYSRTKNAVVIDSTDFEFVNSLQALSHTSGFKCSLTTFTKNTNFGTTTIRRAYINLKSVSRGSLYRSAETVQYDGFIGCVSVPSGFVVVRREDKVFISGNTVNSLKLGISRSDAKAISYASNGGI